MPSESERQAFNVVPPEASATPGVGVTILAATTTAAATAVPAALAHRWVYLLAVGDRIWVTFAAAAATDVDKSKAGGATFAAGTHAANGMPIAAGERVAVRLDPVRHAYIKWQADTTNSKLIVWPATPGRGL